MNDLPTIPTAKPSRGPLYALCAVAILLASVLALVGPQLLAGQPQRFAVIDLSGIVRKHQMASVALLADSSTDQQARRSALSSAREFGQRLDREVIALSKECGCVLLMREAVVAGQLDDYTQALLSRLESRH